MKLRTLLVVTSMSSVSCHHRSDATCSTNLTTSEASPESADSEDSEAEPSSSQEAMARLLSHRDDAPSCEDVAALSAPEEAMDDLIWISENVQRPPWVGIRAAGCVIENHGTEAAFVLLGWTLNPELLGLGWLVLDQLDALPQDVAIAIASMALVLSPDIDAARTRIANAENPTIAGLATITQEEASSTP